MDDLRALEEINCVPVDQGPVEIPPINYVYIVILAIMSGMFSGLNLGLLGLDVK